MTKHAEHSPVPGKQKYSSPPHDHAIFLTRDPLKDLSLLFEKQTQILKRIASQEDCVVVGWAGVFLLPRHRGMFSVFCHAPKSFRVKRLMSIYRDLTEEKARALITESDRTREIYFNQMTDHDWTCAKNYHLSIDTSLQPLEKIADLIKIGRAHV